MNVVMSSNGSSFWREEASAYSMQLAMPGVGSYVAHQTGKVITITGENATLDISYRYTVNLHTDSCTDGVSIRLEHGLLLIQVPKASTIQRAL